MHELDDLSGRFWAWRSVSAPRTRDDIPRLDRPAGWLPDVGESAVELRRAECASFVAELEGIIPTEVADRVDHRLLRSAMARVRWELDIARLWHQPRFYVDQAIGPIFDVLLVPGVDRARVAEVTRFLLHVPEVVRVALQVLPSRAVAEFAGLAIGELDGISGRLEDVALALTPIDPESAPQLQAAATAAGSALEELRLWLVAAHPDLPPAAPVGREDYEWFLREVACIPLTAQQIRELGRVESDRAVVWGLIEGRRHANLPAVPRPANADEQVAREAAAEGQVRTFYVDAGLLSQPADLGHYLNLPMPAYLEPLRFLGVADDLTGPSRLDENGTAYVPDPNGELPYFYAANAHDPRAGIVHEGVHYQQLALSWRHPRPVRRHYYDSAANEGIAFYNEELMLAAGLFDDPPATRAIMWNFMRLRALRVELDVGLATGDLTIDQAAELLQRDVGMDRATALEEAAFFAETPGQALSYQVGKTQVLALIADASRAHGPELDLQALHDQIWINGNVPIALLRWELLGLTDELDRIGVQL